MAPGCSAFLRGRSRSRAHNPCCRSCRVSPSVTWNAGPAVGRLACTFPHRVDGNLHGLFYKVLVDLIGFVARALRSHFPLPQLTSCLLMHSLWWKSYLSLICDGIFWERRDIRYAIDSNARFLLAASEEIRNPITIFTLYKIFDEK